MEPKTSYQILSAISASFGPMAMGAGLGFASPAAPSFLAGNDGVNITSRQNDFVSSSVTIGALIGGPCGGIIMGSIGRRMTMVAYLIPYVAGWSFIVAAQNFSMLLIGRLICGFCIGICSVTVPTYIGEISSPNIRGTLASMFQLMVTVGILLALSVGPAFDGFRLIAVVCAIPPIIHSVLMFFCKESPLYLLMKNRKTEAVESLQFLRGSNYDVKEEIKCMADLIENAKTNKISFTEMKKPYIMKPFLISIMLMVFQQLTGNNVVMFNLEIIFQESGSSLGYDISAVIVGIIQVLSTAAGAILIDKIGRRILLLISSFFMGLFIFALGVYFYMQELSRDAKEKEDLADSFGWLPLLSLLGYITAFSIGFGPVPWVMMAEMFFPNVKAFAAGVSTFTNWSSVFLVTVTFGILKETIGAYGTYWMYSAICMTSCIFCYFFVPETKGKTIEEITALFGRKPETSSRKDIL